MKRRRVVLDTNVLVSAVLFRGPPRKVLDLMIEGEIDGFLSAAILDELREVLQRSKFGFSPEQTLRVIEELHGLCEIVSPSARVEAVKSDPDDDRILECAVAARADFIVSGDGDLTRLGVFQGIAILKPSDFLKTFESEKSRK